MNTTLINCEECKINKTINDFYIYKKTNKPHNSCKECCKEKAKKYRQEHKKQIYESNKKYIEKNREKVREWNKKAINKPEQKEKRAEYQKIYHKQHHIKIISNCRKRMRRLLKNKTNHSYELLGCDKDFFIEWIEFQFYDNMSWKNYGSEWDLDHVIPCSSFDLDSIEEQFKCFKWTNLRPYLSFKNRIKNDKIIPFDILMQELKVYCFLKIKEGLLKI